MPSNVLIERKEPMVILTLNRPQVMNALNMDLILELESGLKAAEGDGAIRVVILTGSGKAFCAGGDLEYFLKTKDSAEFFEFNQRCFDVFFGIEKMTKPVIAAVNGYCLAGGFELISACDFVLAGENAVLGDEHINRGLIPGGFSVYRWGRILGIRKAKEILMTGQRYKAKEAETIGIINRAVPADRLLEEAEKLAMTLANKNPKPLSLGKLALNRADDIDLNSHSQLSHLDFIIKFLSFVKSGGVDKFVQKKE